TNRPTSMTINVVCPQAIDAMLVIDVSFSLSSNDFVNAKLAASNFVSYLNLSTDRVGLISFAASTNTYLDKALTNDGASVQASILGLTNRYGTVLDWPMQLAKTNLSQSASNTLRLLVLL